MDIFASFTSSGKDGHVNAVVNPPGECLTFADDARVVYTVDTEVLYQAELSVAVGFLFGDIAQRCRMYPSAKV